MIRPGKTTDIPILVSWLAAGGEEAETAGILTFSKDGFGDYLLNAIEHSTLFIYELSSGDLCGCLLVGKGVNIFNPEEIIAQCLLVYIHPALRGNGYGKELAKVFEDWGQKIGASVLAYAGNPEMLKCMLSADFKEVQSRYMKRLEV